MVEQPSKPVVKRKSCFGEAYSNKEEALALCHQSGACLDERLKNMREKADHLLDLVKKR